ncbi:unnamed protein product [Closterium sp. NIES-53]
MSGASLAHPATADSATRSQWLTQDAAARLAIRNHLPLAERAHFGQHKTAKAMYDAVVACYSSPSTAALGRLILPYLFLELMSGLILLLVRSAAAARARVARVVAVSGGGGGGGSGGGEGGGGGGSGGSGGESGGFGGGGGGSGGGGGGGGGGSGWWQRQWWRSGWSCSEGRFWRWREAAAAASEQDPNASAASHAGSFTLSTGDCYLCVSLDPSIEAAALGASEFALPGTAPTEALHTLTLDSGVSCCFFRDSTTLTPLPAPVPIRLADPSGSPVLACSSTVLPCPAVPSGSLSGVHLPSFSTNLVSTAALQDVMVTTTSPGGVRVRSGSSPLLVSPPLALDSPVAPPPWSLPPLPPSPAAPCLPCVEGRQRATPHSSFPPTTAPLQTLHMDVWGPARVSGQDRERYFVLVVEDYARYTTVFPLHSKGSGLDSYILQSFMLPASPQQNGVAECRIGLVKEVVRTSMIHAAAPHYLWPFADRYAAHQLNLWPRVSLPETSPTLHWMGNVGDASVFRARDLVPFSSIRPRTSSPPTPFPASSLAFPLTSLAGSFTTPPRAVSCPLRTSPLTSQFPFTASSPTALPLSPPSPLFLAPGPPSVDPLPPQSPAPSGATRGVASGGAASRGAASWGGEPASGEPEGAEPGGAESEGADSGGAEPEGAEPGGTEPEGAEPRGTESEGAESEGAEPRGTASAGGAGGSAAGGTRAGGTGATSLGGSGVTAGAGSTGGDGATGRGGARTRGTGAAGAGGVGGAEAGGTSAGGVGARGTRAGDYGAGGTSAGGAGAGGAGAGNSGTGGTSAGGARAGGARAGDSGAGGGGAGGAGAGDPGTGGAGAEGTGIRGAGAGGTGAGNPGAGGAGAGGAGASGPGTGGTWQRRPFLVPPPSSSLPPADSVLRQVLSSFTERREPESRPALPVRAICTCRRVPRPRPPPFPSTHIMAFHPSSVPLRVTLPPPPASSLPAVPDPESHLACAASPTVPCLLAIAVTDTSFESTVASALVAELFDFSVACRLDYATSLVAESESAYVCPPSVEGECALGTDVLEDRQEDFECLAAAVPHLVAMLLPPEGDPDAPDILTPRSYTEAITSPYSSQWQIAMDAEMASWKSTGTYVNVVPPSGANIIDGMWIFRVKRPPGSPPVFKARYFSASASGTPHQSPLLCLPATRSQLHLRTSPSSCEAEIYAGAMAAQELRWLTYLLTDLGERPRSDCHTRSSLTSAIAGRGLATISKAERFAPPGEGISTMELEIATRNIYGTEEHPLPEHASHHFQGIFRGTNIGTFDAEGTPCPYTKEAFQNIYPH